MLAANALGRGFEFHREKNLFSQFTIFYRLKCEKLFCKTKTNIRLNVFQLYKTKFNSKPYRHKTYCIVYCVLYKRDDNLSASSISACLILASKSGKYYFGIERNASTANKVQYSTSVTSHY